MLRLSRLPLLLDASAAFGGTPSSSTSFKGAAIRSRRLLVALILRMLLVSTSLSFRFRSLLFSFRSSFSIRRAHHPAKASQR